MRMHARVILVLVLTALMVAAGLVSVSAGEGKFVFGKLGLIPSMAIIGSGDMNGRWVGNCIMDPLWFYHPFEDEFEPALAVSWDLSDPLAWVFYLREGVKFHDGTDFTAEDVVASVALAQAGGSMAPTFQIINEVEVVDPYTVVFHLDYASSELRFILYTLWMGPDWALEDKETWDAHPIGTGPFKLVDWSPESFVEMEANEDYWMPGVPKLQELEFARIPEDAARVTALLTGEVDGIDTVPGTEIEALQEDPNVQLVQNSSTSYQFLWMNAGRPPFNDPRVRQAVRHAIDTETLRELVWPVLGQKAESIIPHGLACFAAQEDILYDPEESQRLLAEAGYPDGLRLTVTKRDQLNSAEEGDVIVSMLNQAGFIADYVILQSPVFVETVISNGDYEMAIFAHRGTNPDPANIIRRLYSAEARDLTWWSTQGESAHAQFEEAIANAITATDDACMYWAEVQRVMWEHGTVMNLNDVKNYFAVGAHVSGFVGEQLTDFRYVEVSE